MTFLDSEHTQQWVKRLLAHPARIEPGMLLQAHPISLRSGAVIELHGIDLLGRPCLFGFFECMDPVAWDWVLESITSFREGIEGSDPIYQRGREPRLFLLGQEWQVEDFARLRFLAQNIAIRGYRLKEFGSMDLCFPAVDAVDPNAWVEHVAEKDRMFIERLLAAAGRGGQKVQVMGGFWPLNLVNADGPFASLHQNEDGLLMSVPAEPGRYRILDLNQSRDRDLAIDSVMRHRLVGQNSE